MNTQREAGTLQETQGSLCACAASSVCVGCSGVQVRVSIGSSKVSWISI